MSGLLILKSDWISVSVPAVGTALLPNRPTVRQENKGKSTDYQAFIGRFFSPILATFDQAIVFFFFLPKHLSYNFLSSADDFWGFTYRY